jgi:sugar O-acyltransferase (sialic acid O-acetyltransferase NeuD family)
MKSKGCLLIIGAGGHGQVAADIALKMGAWQNIFFADDHKVNQSVMGIKVLCTSTDAHYYVDKAEMFVAIGDNKIRASIQNQLKNLGASFPMLIHPNSTIGFGVEIGEGSIVMPGVVINCNSKLGKGCIVNTGATVDHDNNVGDFVHISPGANLAGDVYVDDYTWLGIGSAVVNGIKVTHDCIIGAGAVVLSDIHSTGTYVGVPARRIK